MDIADIVMAIVVIVAACAAFYYSTKSQGDKYDERQVAAMGKGCKWAFWTVAVLLGAGSLIYDEPTNLPVSASDYMFLSLIMGGSVYMLYAVWHGAYFGVREKNARACGILFAVLGAVNAFFASQGDSAVDIAYGLCSLAVGIVILVRLRLDAREAAAEDGNEGEDDAE